MENWKKEKVTRKQGLLQRLLSLAGFDEEKLTAALPEMEETFLSLRHWP